MHALEAAATGSSTPPSHTVAGASPAGSRLKRPAEESPAARLAAVTLPAMADARRGARGPLVAAPEALIGAAAALASLDRDTIPEFGAVEVRRGECGSSGPSIELGRRLELQNRRRSHIAFAAAHRPPWPPAMDTGSGRTDEAPLQSPEVIACGECRAILGDNLVACHGAEKTTASTVLSCEIRSSVQCTPGAR